MMMTVAVASAKPINTTTGIKTLIKSVAFEFVVAVVMLVTVDTVVDDVISNTASSAVVMLHSSLKSYKVPGTVQSNLAV